MNILGLFVDQAKIAKAIADMALYAPGTLGDEVAQQLESVSQRSPGTGLWDSALVVLALWTVSTAVVSMMSSVRAVYGRPKARQVLLRLSAFGIGLVGVVLVGGLMVVAAVARTFGSGALVAEAIVAVMLLAALIAAFYWLSGGYGGDWRANVPGAVAAALAQFVIVVGVSVYADHAPTAKGVYGTAGGVVLSMLAIWLSVYAVMLGALLNARASGLPSARK